MKMSDVFKSELLPSHIRVKSTPVKSSMDDSVAAHEFICDAVNNHDKLKERVKELKECLSDFDAYQSTSCDYKGSPFQERVHKLLEKE